MVAVHHPQPPPVGRGVNGLVADLDAAEVVAVELAREFVVVARHEHHPAALAGAAQQFLHHVVVRLRPEPFATQLPAINDVAHQVQGLARVVLQELQQGAGLATRRAQMQIGNENGPVAGPFSAIGWMLVVGIGADGQNPCQPPTAQCFKGCSHRGSFGSASPAEQK
ncbi:hypothetical protein D9M68_858590 [compost metagenome]